MSLLRCGIIADTTEKERIPLLKRDTAAAFTKSGISIFSRYRFESGSFVAAKTMNRGAYDRLMSAQAAVPAIAAEDEARQRRWWLYQNEFYWEDEGFDARGVLALILNRETQKDRRLKRAIALMEQTALPDDSRRAPIADEVKAFVWNRDGGKCVTCGGNERLEFDHVIPVAMGGANTARNLQLLCEACNRAKGASIT